MSFLYTRSQFKSRINGGIHGRQGMLIDFNETVNQVVRDTYQDVDFRSAKRKAVLTPNLYNGIFDYACPTDLSANKIVDIPAQAGRQDGEFFLTTPTEFDISHPKAAIALDTFNGTRVIKVNSSVDSESILVAELDSLTSGGGTWSSFGDGTNLERDNADYIKGTGSISFDISSAGGTTAGIVNTSVNSVDLTDYMGGTSSIFVWAKINSATNLTNYILRFGSSASDYYSKTVTTQHDGTAFVSGWNLLRFDVTSLTTTGSPSISALTYFAIYMTKTAGKISETDYKFDYLVVKKGVIHNVAYYTKYGWQSSSGAYKNNSTDDLDVLVADDDEYELLVQNGIQIAAREVREYDISKEHGSIYDRKLKQYKMTNPSEAKIMSTEYYTY